MQKNRVTGFYTMASAILVTGLVVVAADVNAEMYKWVDEDGNTHYTQQKPPDGLDYETKKPPPPVDTEKAVDAFKEKQDADREKREAASKSEEEAAKTEQEQAEIKKKCDSLKLRLQSLQRPRISTTDESGNRVRMSEEERKSQMEEVQKLISEHCK